MPYRLDVHGDPIEREYATYIGASLSGYEKIWSGYLGNDGKSWLPPLPDHPNHDERRRQLTSQYTYSCLESVLALELILRDTADINTSGFSESRGRDDYLRMANLFLAFYAHVGRIRDLVGKLGDMWGDGNLADKLDEYYGQRSNVLHETLLLFA